MMIICGICYDLNQLDTGSGNSQKLGVNNAISTITTDIWKDIYKRAFMKKQAGEDNKLNNHPNFAYSYNASTELLEQLIPIISTSFISEAIISHFLNILALNSNFIIVCDYIYLLLLLN